MKHIKKVLILSGITAAAAILLSYRARAGVFAQKFVGIGEFGANKGFTDSVFQSMMKHVGWKGGEAWCMYFAKAVHYETFKNDQDKIMRILNGSTQRSWQNVLNDASGTYRAVTSGRPRKGDIAIWQNSSNRSLGHAGVVIRSGRDKFVTVEGNTNLAGSREGDRILEKERPLTYGKAIPGSNLVLLGFIRKKI